MKTIIGLAGVKTSGKSTVAKIIKQAMPDQNVTESALADKLKNVCAHVFSVPRESFDRQDLKEVPFIDGPKELTEESILGVLFGFDVRMNQGEFYDKYRNIIGTKLDTPRKIAQIVGTQILRETGNENIHCENVELSDDIVIISDLRFPNEFNYFNNSDEFNFIPLYIQRDEAESKVTANSHASETSVFLFSDKCSKLDNNGTIEDLSAQVWSKLLELGLAGDTSKRA
jgi:hypothetical protein